MSDYSTSANVVLTVNGRQAQKMMSQLEKDAKRLEQGIAKAAVAGDKATMKKLQRELNSTRRMMEQLRGTTSSVEDTLRSLDRATPKELNKTLRDLQKQLNSIERGSAAWDAHMSKIKAVKEELRRVNEEMRPDESLSDKFNNWLNRWQTALVGAAGIVTGLVMAGRKAVNTYAEMEQEMAYVRKYTGMEAEEVAALNEEFKKINTRSSREELNRLAQEAGRLGKTSQEDVLGFVRAADKINVALDDLGDGATLTLSKLTGIFGDEKRLGTERALLSVGSVINELSQNCSASAPYIASFASRLGGVGAQANLTVQQIMGYAAVLDSNNQKLEASSTALSQVIVRIYQDPAKYAKVAGINVSKFTKLVKRDMNAALIEFLSTLKRAGNMDVLSPMFKDMGENGSRAIAALSTLSNHIAEVKAQQEVANQAFAEATSIDKEYDVQNNTVMAGLDKARKRVKERVVELGEKLQPLMKYVYSSSGVAMRVLSQMVDFFIKYRTEILAAVTAVVAYNTIMLVYNTRTALAAKATSLFHGAMKLCHGVVPALRLLMVPLINTVQYFTNGLEVNYTMQQRWRKAMAGMNFASWTALILTAATAVFSLAKRHIEARKAAEENRRKHQEWIDSLTDTERESEEYSRKERKRLVALYLAATDETKSKEERIKATNKLQKLYPDYFKNLTEEQIMLGQAKDKYEELYQSIIDTARARAAMSKIEKNEGQLLDLEDEEKELTKQRLEAQKKLNSVLGYDSTERGPILNYGDGKKPAYLKLKNQSLNNAFYSGPLLDDLWDILENLKKNLEKQEIVKDKIWELQMRYNLEGKTSEDIDESTDDDSGKSWSSTRTETEKERKAREARERREAVKARKEFKEKLDQLKGEWEEGSAQNTSDYSAGLKSWSDFQREKYNLEMRYFDYRLKLYDDNNLQEDEDYKELLKKKAERQAAWFNQMSALSVDEARRKQKVDEDFAQMDFLTPGSAIYQNEEALQQRLFEIKLRYLKQMRAAYNVDSKEHHEYSEQIAEAEANEQLRRQKMIAQKVAEWRKEYEYLEAGERYKFETDIAKQALDAKLMTEEEYQQALADLRRKYADQYAPESAKPDTPSNDDFQKKKTKELEQWESLYNQELIDKETFEQGKARIEEKYREKSQAAARSVGNEHLNMLLDITDAWNAFFDKSGDKSKNWATNLANLASGVFAVMTAGLDAYSEYQQACADLEVAKTEKKYEAMIKAAGDNDEEVKRLEEERDAETSKIKKEAADKAFAVQVAQAIATTAINAIAAYGSAQTMPYPASQIFGVLAASLATAQGLAQIAIIKKQKEVSDTQGYAEGGFTRPGGKYEPVGVVHAGEWVASQKLVNNPRTRPLLEALDYAQRTNTIGSIRMTDVSRSVTAPMILAAQPSAPTVVTAPAPTVLVEQNADYAATMRRLVERLSEPFVTVNTVTGDFGSKRANDDYNKLMRNKSPKSKK